MSEIQPVLNECKFKYDAHMNFLIDLEQSGEAYGITSLRVVVKPYAHPVIKV
jgi:hypothetical protein